MADLDDEIPLLPLTDDYGMAKAGWAAWSRNTEGYLSSCHAPFTDMAEWQDYVLEETQLGYRVFYPPGPLKVEVDRG